MCCNMILGVIKIMYVNPFLLGVLSTIMAEIIIIFVIPIIILMLKNKGE